VLPEFRDDTRCSPRLKISAPLLRRSPHSPISELIHDRVRFSTKEQIRPSHNYGWARLPLRTLYRDREGRVRRLGGSTDSAVEHGAPQPTHTAVPGHCCSQAREMQMVLHATTRPHALNATAPRHGHRHPPTRTASKAYAASRRLSSYRGSSVHVHVLSWLWCGGSSETAARSHAHIMVCTCTREVWRLVGGPHARFSPPSRHDRPLE